MFFVLSKILSFLLLPFYWLFALLVYALKAKPSHSKNKAILLSMLVMYVYTTDLVPATILRLWEYPMVWVKDLEGKYDAAIVLGGMCAPGKLPDDRTHFGGSPDRLLHALMLYKKGIVDKVIITGGSGELLGQRIPEAQYLANVLLLSGVPASAILQETKSRNTRENALFTRELIENKLNPQGRYLLVTSAWHMKRSQACFEKVGLATTPFPTDSYLQPNFIGLNTFLPNLSAPAMWQTIFHEVVGYFSYLAKGYI